MRLGRLVLAVVAFALLAPAAAHAECSEAPPDETAGRCNIVADSFTATPNPVAIGQNVTFAASVHSEPASNDPETKQTGEHANNVEYKFEPFDPGDDPGDVVPAETKVTSQPQTVANRTWTCSTAEPVTCHGPLDAGDHVTFQAVYKATGQPRNAFMDLTMTFMEGELFGACGSGGTTVVCDDDDENAFTELQIAAASGGGGGQNPGGGGGVAVKDVIPPAFLGASITPRTFFVGSNPTAEFAATKTGTKIVYNLSEAGLVRILVERKLEGRRVKRKCVRKTRKNRTKRKCARYVKKGELVRRAAQGISVVPWSGRVGNRVMKPGRYRLSLSAVDGAGNRSAPRRMFFRIKKKPKRKH